MAARTCHPSTQRWKQEEQALKTIPGCIRPCLNSKQITTGKQALSQKASMHSQPRFLDSKVLDHPVPCLPSLEDPDISKAISASIK